MTQTLRGALSAALQKNTPDREILNLSRLGMPGGHVLGRYQFVSPHPPLATHSHPGMVEICFLYRGVQNYELAGKSYQLRGGDMFVTMPGESHSSGHDPEDRGVLYWLILDTTSAGNRFLGLSATDGQALISALLEMPARLFRAPRNSRSVLDGFFLESAFGARLRGVSRRSRMVTFLLDVIQASRSQMRRSSGDWVQPILRHMEAHLGGNLQVPDFAALAKLSVPRFKTRFRESVGKAPAEYYLFLRIEEAKRRLSLSRQPVTQIAMDLGFSSSQSFATAFRRLAGCSPSAHRSNPASEKSEHGEKQ